MNYLDSKNITYRFNANLPFEGDILPISEELFSSFEDLIQRKISTNLKNFISECGGHFLNNASIDALEGDSALKEKSIHFILRFYANSDDGNDHDLFAAFRLIKDRIPDGYIPFATTEYMYFLISLNDENYEEVFFAEPGQFEDEPPYLLTKVARNFTDFLDRIYAVPME